MRTRYRLWAFCRHRRRGAQWIVDLAGLVVDSQPKQNRRIGESMRDPCLSQIYLLPVKRSRPPRGVTLPDDAGWIFTAPDPAIDAVAEYLGDATDRPVQIVDRLSVQDIEPEQLMDVIETCFESGPNPVLVLDADLAHEVRDLVCPNRARVQELTSTSTNIAPPGEKPDGAIQDEADLEACQAAS